MSLDFDHDTPLQKGEKPSIHRLRARAAKSAIKRYNLLPKIIKQRVDKISDPEEKIRVGLRLAEEARMEVRELAQTLLALIPTNAPPPEGKDLDIETIKFGDAKLLPIPDPDSFVAIQEEAPYPWKEAIRKQFGEDYVDDPYLNAEEIFVKEFLHKHGIANATAIQSDDDVDFVSEWAQQQSGDDGDELYLA